ncbi:MAG: hypothetical protein ACLP5H_10100 [Desulfomonilaceae bacterium]
MNSATARFCIITILSVIIAAAVCTSAVARVPEGYRDVKLGMNKSQVLSLLQQSPLHFTYDDMGDEVGEIIRGDDLFRYALYRFDGEGILVEIGLEMREILGRDRVLELYNSQHGLKLTPRHATVEADFSIEVRDNCLVMKKMPVKDTRSAKGTS